MIAVLFYLDTPCKIFRKSFASSAKMGAFNTADVIVFLYHKIAVL